MQAGAKNGQIAHSEPSQTGNKECRRAGWQARGKIGPNGHLGPASNAYLLAHETSLPMEKRSPNSKQNTGVQQSMALQQSVSLHSRGPPRGTLTLAPGPSLLVVLAVRGVLRASRAARTALPSASQWRTKCSTWIMPPL